MNSLIRLPFFVFAAACLLLLPVARAQEDPLKDPDLAAALKQAEEFQKNNPPAKMSDLKKQADEIEAEQKEEARKEKAALQKQLEAPGPVNFPDWTPATPDFTANGSPAKKIEDDEVRIVQTGTSTRSPKEIGDAWEAAVAEKELNHTRNNITTNGNPSVVLYLSNRSEPQQEVRLEARREAESKVTRVSISSPLPKPETDDD